ncbi:MAG: hypothetical protein Q8P60_04000, partial [Pseudorhodobacter sp.]|nr:hypothetical protein [Pseudorhodobacter sp.]
MNSTFGRGRVSARPTPNSTRRVIRRREIIRTGVPATTPWNDDFQRIIRNFVGDADASLTGAFSPALDVEET